MPEVIRAYVRWVDRVNRWIGRVVMLLVFVMMGILLYSAYTKNFSIPPIWAIEVAQFTMAAYYLLGGAYALQMDSHVRMDLAYSRWTPRTRAAVDAVTVLFLVFYLGVLLAGGLASTEYALKYNETYYSSWAPRMAPIKIIMCIGIVLMLLQAVSTFFRNLAEARGEPLP
ncbi:MAG TPA: TRAP transporter small permease subunit [Thermohalobaculum sp.]|nr:TRAP transporter small permease subunit [Thermohalobaculum sp.]